jgi:hypothetical protein
MAEIPSLDPSEAPRARRWDALILGSGIRALVAGARISVAGHRVLIVEEAARTALSPALREPFFLGGLRDEGVLDACLRELRVPLIDRRRLVPERLSYQIAADPYRLDVGQPQIMVDELVAWGLQSPEEARKLVQQLLTASETERRILLEASFIRIGRRLGRSRGGVSPGGHTRGLPGDASSARGAMRDILDAQLRALSNLGASEPTPEASARLLGLGLAGGIGFSDAPPWLIDLLRKRVTALYGDFRSVGEGFELVSVSGQPGIRVSRTGEIWLGRALVLGTAPSALADLYANYDLGRPPKLLETTRSRRYRAAFLYRVPVEIVPEGMGARLMLPGSQGAVAVTAFPSQTHPGKVDLVARALLEHADLEARADQEKALQEEIADRLRGLMPFSGDSIHRIDAESPQWDSDDGWLEDPPAGHGWPSEIDLRISSRPPIYHLDRAAVGGLGLEGDLLLGWHGGDAIAEELA